MLRKLMIVGLFFIQYLKPGKIIGCEFHTKFTQYKDFNNQFCGRFREPRVDWNLAVSADLNH